MMSLSAAAQAETDSISTHYYSYEDCSRGIRQWHKFNWGRSATNIALRIGLRLSIDQLLKNNVRELRPDGSDYRSFPSRHSTWAYGMAGTITYTLGAYSPWWAIGSQTAANIVGFQRVMTRRHYPGDVFAGAGIGISIDLVSKTIANAIFGGESMFGCWRYADNDFRASASVSTGAAFPLSSAFGDLTLGTALMSTLRAQFPATDWAGFSVSTSMMTSPVKAKGQRVCRRPLNSIRIGLGPSAHAQIADGPFAVGGSAEGGYQANLKTRGYDINDGSAYVSINAFASVMLTQNLAIGADAGISVYKLRLDDCSKKVASPQVGFFTKAIF